MVTRPDNPQVKGKKRKVKLLDKDAASYLDMTGFTFSRLVREWKRGEEIMFVCL